MRTPWPHQLHGLGLLRASLQSGHRRPMLASPTGSGKTGLAAMIVEGALRKGKRVGFCLPAKSLIDQTVKVFAAEGITQVGVVQADHPMTDPTQPVQVMSVQTLQRRDLPQLDVVVIDEAHVWFKFYGDWMADPAWRHVPFIGLSATPWRSGLGKHFDDLLVVTTTADLIRNGFLSPFRVFAPSHPDLSAVSTVAGDFHEGELAVAMDTPTLVADVVDNWLRHGEDRPTLCFAVNRAHADHLRQQFEAAGVPAGYIDAHTSLDGRDAIAKQFYDGSVKVVCNVGCLTTGIDWDVRCVILARPTQSEMLFTQIIGRGLRLADGKLDCLVFDHSDTHQRLGFVTDIHHDKLSKGGERATAKPRARPENRECSGCHFVMPAKWSVCPSCGFRPERKCEVEVQDGELLEFGAPQAEKARVSAEELQRWYSALIRVGAERGYKPGWAANKFKDKFGHYPRGLWDGQGPVGHDVARWIKASQIKWAKRRAA